MKCIMESKKGEKKTKKDIPNLLIYNRRDAASQILFYR